MPERLASIPGTLWDVMRDTDLLLHAGDVGELWVLDRLSDIAPVVAVHGNDDTPDAQRELPGQQLVSVAGKRILLWHSHFPDPAEEVASRGGFWPPKLARLADQGRRAGAEVVVFGHAHVPVVYEQDGILLVNPGALASGSLFSRQERRTVAELLISSDGGVSAIHLDLSAPDRSFEPRLDLQAEFAVALRKYQSPIMEPDLQEEMARLVSESYLDGEAVKEAILTMCHRCWSGEKLRLSRNEMMDGIARSDGLHPVDREKILTALSARAT
jgi:putative phosphoesterase